ncbi:MAG: DUF2007 domain-containing protein [Candidatus Cloacimonetes bacterium]|nr:DUF2007 domain-containing protein [Candidatus Cloacimonadota bacterium]
MLTENEMLLEVFDDRIEAELLEGLLKSSGIECFIVSDDCDGMMPQLQLTEGVGVVINKADKEEAMKILEDVKKRSARE